MPSERVINFSGLQVCRQIDVVCPARDPYNISEFSNRNLGLLLASSKAMVFKLRVVIRRFQKHRSKVYRTNFSCLVLIISCQVATVKHNLFQGTRFLHFHLNI